MVQTAFAWACCSLHPRAMTCPSTSPVSARPELLEQDLERLPPCQGLGGQRQRPQPEHAAAGIRWFEASSEQVLADIEQAFAEFRSERGSDGHLQAHLGRLLFLVFWNWPSPPTVNLVTAQPMTPPLDFRTHAVLAAPFHALPHRGGLQPLWKS